MEQEARGGKGMNPIKTQLYREISEGRQSQLTQEFDIPNEFDTVQYRVVQILKRFSETRGNYELLLYHYYKEFEGIDTQLDKVQTKLQTILRSRRDIVKRNPELDADEVIKEFRSARELAFRKHYGKNREAIM